MPCSRTATSVRRSWPAAGTISCRSRTTNRPHRPTSKPRSLARPRVFPPRQSQARDQSFEIATTVDKGHGRREKRTLMSTTWRNDDLDWPEVGQVFLLRRERTVGGTTTVEEVFGERGGVLAGSAEATEKCGGDPPSVDPRRQGDRTAV